MLAFITLLAASAVAAAQTIKFQGTDYVHRWSKEGQHEFTPPNDADLAKWRDMVTINVHEGVGNGDQLAELANSVLANYRNHGNIMRTDSKARTPGRPAEHMIGAVLGNVDFLEAAFARFLLLDGKGIVVVYSHRIYGRDVGRAMNDWLRVNGTMTEQALMEWSGMPSVTTLKRLPQTR